MKATKRKVSEPIDFSPAPVKVIKRAKADFNRCKIKINSCLINNYKFDSFKMCCSDSREEK